MADKVLLVDDEPNVLQGYKRHLRKAYDLSLAEGGEQALAILRNEGPFAVVVSDMQMPEVNGLKLLSHIHHSNPETVRIMLTGNADQKTAVDAVNDGQIFRFLNKPCSPEVLQAAIEAGLQQYRLIRAEKELLSKTLSGSVALMTEVLSMANPKAFGRAMRVKRLARLICDVLQVRTAWDIEIAAMLSQVGCVSIPDTILAKLYDGTKLTPEESELWQSHPRVGAELVSKIPRLDGVAKMIANQHARFDSLSGPDAPDLDDHQQLGASILKVVLEHDAIATRSSFVEAARTIAQDRSGRYEPKVSHALAEVANEHFEIRSIDLGELEVGMIFEEHLQTTAGGILVPKGQEVTETLIKRLKNFGNPERFIRQPFRVRVIGALVPVETH